MKQIDEQQFNELIAGSKPVVCDFFATWCGPCKMLAPVLEKVSADYADKAEFVKVDVDGAPALSAQYGIMSIPFVAVFKDGKDGCKVHRLYARRRSKAVPRRKSLI